MKYFIISIEIQSKIKYFAYDCSSGGYPYWSSQINSAFIFNDSEKDIIKIDEEIAKILDTKLQEFSDGTKYPNTTLSSGLELNRTNLKNNGIIKVSEIIFNVKKQFTVEAEIILPVKEK